MKDDIETLPERLVRTELKDVTGALLGSAADEICRLRTERDSLRGKLGKATKALQASLEDIVITIAFIGRDKGSERLPETLEKLCAGLVSRDSAIRSVIFELSADAPAQQTQISDEVREAMGEAEKALEFYAEPEKAKDRLGRPVCVPDFYNELDFGDVARAAIAKLRSVMK